MVNVLKSPKSHSWNPLRWLPFRVVLVIFEGLQIITQVAFSTGLTVKSNLLEGPPVSTCYLSYETSLLFF